MIVEPPLLNRELPGFVRDLLGSAPQVGQGVDKWVYRVARLLHTYRQPDEIVALLHAALHGEKLKRDQIERAVRNSKADVWKPGLPLSKGCSPTKWPPLDSDRRSRIVRAGPNVAELRDMSPSGFVPDDADETVERLFSTAQVPDPLLCVGKNSSTFATRRMSVWIHRDKLTRNQFIVPSPMCKRRGTTKEGTPSEHCLDNTGPRRFLVVEFDEGTTDEHAALLWHLTDYAPLTMVVDSGGKSLHGWFFCREEREPDLKRFMECAVSIGADDATWTRCQFVRLPAGLRKGGVRQNVLYFDSATLQQAGGSDGK